LKLLINEDIQYVTKDVTLYCDNGSTVKLARDPIASDRTKHIEIRYRKVQEFVDNDEMLLHWVSTKNQLADVMTKALPRETFETLRSSIGVYKY
jgi:hypothetical protein